MKLLSMLLGMMLIATTAFAMATGPTGCHKTDSCFSTWQCYSSSISDCQDKAKREVDWKTDSTGYWKVVGECQAGFCNQ